MIKLEVTGACIDCPFIQVRAVRVDVGDRPYWYVKCVHENYCDREVEDE